MQQCVFFSPKICHSKHQLHISPKLCLHHSIYSIICYNIQLGVQIQLFYSLYNTALPPPLWHRWLLNQDYDDNKNNIAWLTEQFAYLAFIFCCMLPSGTLHTHTYTYYKNPIFKTRQSFVYILYYIILYFHLNVEILSHLVYD